MNTKIRRTIIYLFLKYNIVLSEVINYQEYKRLNLKLFNGLLLLRRLLSDEILLLFFIIHNNAKCIMRGLKYNRLID